MTEEEEKRLQELEAEKSQLEQSVDDLKGQLTFQKEKCKRGRKTRLHRAIQLLLFSIKKVKRTNTKRKKRGVIKVFWRGLTFKDIIPIIVTIIFGVWGIRLTINQTYLQEADRRSGLVFLMGNIFDEVNTELKDDYNNDSIRNLSPQLIGRIVAFSHSLTPYKFFVNGELTDREYSPERGQLLITLVNSGIDKASLDVIYKKADLSYTYLVDANLDSAYLKSADLFGSYLRYTDIRFADLRGADLRKSDLFDVNFQESDLRYTKLFNANLLKSELVGTDLRHADLNKANIDMATLTKNTQLDSVKISTRTKRGDAKRWSDFKKEFCGVDEYTGDSTFYLVEIIK